jgi:hypothetical protein
MHRQEHTLRHYQTLRDELRKLLLDYFEYHELIQDSASKGRDVAALRANFDELKRRLKDFWVLHDHVGDFIPALVDVDGALNERRQAFRRAKQYLLLLLPETPVSDSD